MKKIDNKKITILGAGISGIGAAHLASELGAQVFISDSNINLNPKINKYKFESGKHSKKIYECDFAVISPGIDPRQSFVKEFSNLNIPVFSEIDFSSWFTKSPIIAVTGSNGKSTTVSLIHQILINAGFDSKLGGNIGISFAENIIDEIKKCNSKTIHVLELSSFQLEYCKNIEVDVGVILNISEDHLDRYENFEEYVGAKMSLVKLIKTGGRYIYNSNYSLLANTSRKDIENISFTSLDLFNNNSKHEYYSDLKFVYNNNDKEKINLENIKLKGMHNYENILAAVSVSSIYNINLDVVSREVENFQPLIDRMESIAKIDGVEYINDSKSTNLNSTLSALSSYKENVILILGGEDKGNTDFSEIQVLFKSSIKKIVTYGKSGMKIFKQFDEIGDKKYIENFDKCIDYVFENSVSGDTVLLSPGCASYDQFKSYKERGQRYRELINKLKE